MLVYMLVYTHVYRQDYSHVYIQIINIHCSVLRVNMLSDRQQYAFCKIDRIDPFYELYIEPFYVLETIVKNEFLPYVDRQIHDIIFV